MAVVTGVSHRRGIGFAIARQLLDEGWAVYAHGWSAAERAAGSTDHAEIVSMLKDLGGTRGRLEYFEADLSEAGAAEVVIDRASQSFGRVDALVVNHAASLHGDLFVVTAEDLDRAWAVNARSAVLLTKAFARRHDPGTPGSVVLFSSGQHLGPMGEELAYAISKGAIQQMTGSLADTLAPHQITVNAINPGPTDTGWIDDGLRAPLATAFPTGRIGLPRDVAPVVSWLLSEGARWVTGQTINVEGGFRR